MTQWQHAWISVDPMKSEDISKLETFGKEGWEMVSVLPWGQAWQFDKSPHMVGEAEHATIAPSGSSIFLMFFKRPIEESASGMPGFNR
jgi:hypothetical protein